MVLCDSSVGLALTLFRHAHNGAVRRWLEGIAEPGSVYFKQFRGVQLELLRE